jgi:electron transport complex protein RnfG
MKLPAHKPLALAILLGGMALVGMSAVSVVFYASKEKIEQNQQNALLEQLWQVLSGQRYDNNPLADSEQVVNPLLGDAQPKTVYLVKYQGKPVALVITSTAGEGYNGAILLLVAIKTNGTLIGVQVVSHQETPGLGDKIERERGDWISGFDSHSLTNPQAEQWAVKRDGGAFDQLTGATITARAVVKAVKNTLRYYQIHQADLK